MNSEKIKINKRCISYNLFHRCNTYDEILKSELLQISNKFNITYTQEHILELYYIYYNDIPNVPLCKICKTPLKFISRTTGYNIKCENDICFIQQSLNKERNKVGFELAKFHKNKRYKESYANAKDFCKNIKNLSNKTAQILYHYVENLNEVPRHENGAIKIWQNWNLKYAEFDVQLPQVKYNIFEVYSKDELIHYFRLCGNSLYKIMGSPNTNPIYKLICETNKHCTKLSKRQQIDLFLNPEKNISKCKLCENYTLGNTPLCEKHLEYDNIIKYFNTDIDIAIEEMYKLNKIKRSKLFKILLNNDILKYDTKCNNILTLFPNDYAISFMQFYFHYIHDEFEIPTCKHCNKTLYNKFNRNLYFGTCSNECNNKCRENIEKRLINNSSNMQGFYTNTGKNENIILTAIEAQEKIKIQRGKCILGYFPDGLYENQIFEVNENYHLSNQQIEKDLIRYNDFIKAGYKINVTWDINKNTNNKKIKILLDTKYKNIFNTVSYYKYKNTQKKTKSNKFKVCTPDGFKKFDNIKEHKNIKCIKINSDITVSLDHLFYNNNWQIIIAEDLKIDDIIKFENCDIKISSIEYIDEMQSVYDLINVNSHNNSYFTNSYVSHNCSLLCMDELAFISKNIMDEFASSVFPVISSTKGTKMIVVSTPNGTGNWFYETFNRAQLNPDGEWKSTKLNWDVFPGRDEAWKLQMIETFGGGDAAIRKFAQEFENKFFGTGFSLIDNIIIRELNERYVNWIKTNKPNIKSLIKNEPKFDLIIMHKPEKDHVYSLGYDTAEGIGGDSSTIHVLDITNVKKLKVVAVYGCNNINPHDFSYVIAKTSRYYNHAHCLGEANGIGHTVISNLHLVYELDELINYENKRRDVGMYLTNTVKNICCCFLKDNLKLDEIEILSPKLIEELEYFERKQSSSGRNIFAASVGHDDYVLSFIYAFFALFPEIADNYWIVTYENDKLGNPKPIAFKDYIPYFNSKDDLDSKFKNDYNIVNINTDDKSNSGSVYVFDEDSIGQNSSDWVNIDQHSFSSSHTKSSNEVSATFKF